MKIEDMTPLQLVAGVLWGEARGEGELGEDAVASVMMNRAKIAGRFKSKHGKPHPTFGDGSLRAVCLAPYQFSCLNANDPNLAQIEALDFDHPDDALDVCLEVAGEAIDGTLVDNTNGSTHYHVSTDPWPKAWGAPVPARAVIGHHSFYLLP